MHKVAGIGSSAKNQPRDKVFEWLERSYQERSNRLLWLGIEEDMDWLRSDPRLESLLRRIGWK